MENLLRPFWKVSWLLSSDGDDLMNLMYAYLIGWMYSRFSFASVQNMTMTEM